MVAKSFGQCIKKRGLDLGQCGNEGRNNPRKEVPHTVRVRESLTKRGGKKKDMAALIGYIE